MKEQNPNEKEKYIEEARDAEATLKHLKILGIENKETQELLLEKRDRATLELSLLLTDEEVEKLTKIYLTKIKIIPEDLDKRKAYYAARVLLSTIREGNELFGV